MRNWLNISIVALYAFLSIGMQIHLHYCCGKLSDISFYAPVKGCEDKSQEEGCCFQTNCCEFSDINLKLEDEHQPSSGLNFYWVLPLAETPTIAAELTSNLAISHPVSEEYDTGPGMPRYLQFHALILYA